MKTHTIIACLAAAFATALALAVLFRKRRSLAGWAFCAGMIVLAAESVLSAISFRETEPEKIGFWQALVLQTKAFVPIAWLTFSLSFSRGNYREFLQRSRLLLAGALLLPVVLTLGAKGQLLKVIPYGEGGSSWWVGYSGAAKLGSAAILLASVLVLMNLERTFRSAVGTIQWRIKFVLLGVGVLFGTRFYTGSQALIYSGDMLAGSGIEAGGILVGCTFIAVGYLRGAFGSIDLYPSRAALHTSFTVMLAGAYLVVIGVLAQIVARTGGSSTFQLQALLILLGIAFLAVLLLSKRLRQSVEHLISRHFKRPQHDFRQIWSRFTKATGNLLEPSAVSHVAAGLISETFNALSISVWLADKREERLMPAASTFSRDPSVAANGDVLLSETSKLDLRKISHPFDLDRAKGEWAASLRSATAPQFHAGGNRIAVPLRASDTWLGLIVLADRVNGVPYTAEEFDLLKCIGDQVAASLLNLQLTQDVMLGKELEAFQTISAFFVHDLKNAASTLTLMLQNLPVHFDDPAFRADALRGISRTADRINQLISSLSVVRQKLALDPIPFDLNQLVEEALESLKGAAAVELVKEFQPLPEVVADRAQLQSVVTNLLLNARDAVAEEGTVMVKTAKRQDWATLTVSDDGCGMSPAFLRDSLFRPFSTTKKKGLGIGMFQSKMIVEAHGGNIQVTSNLGKGTTFSVFLPFRPVTE